MLQSSCSLSIHRLSYMFLYLDAACSSTGPPKQICSIWTPLFHPTSMIDSGIPCLAFWTTQYIISTHLRCSPEAPQSNLPPSVVVAIGLWLYRNGLYEFPSAASPLIVPGPTSMAHTHQHILTSQGLWMREMRHRTMLQPAPTWILGSCHSKVVFPQQVGWVYGYWWQAGCQMFGSFSMMCQCSFDCIQYNLWSHFTKTWSLWVSSHHFTPNPAWAHKYLWDKQKKPSTYLKKNNEKVRWNPTGFFVSFSIHFNASLGWEYTKTDSWMACP